METVVRHLQQRNELFEDGLAKIRQKLSDDNSVSLPLPHPRPPSASTITTSTTTGQMMASTTRSGRPLSSSNQGSDEANRLTTTTAGEPPVNNATTSYLLSVHESLREEVAQLSHAVRDLDARASMTIMNECLRINEDMAHTNAALGSIRMQIQWLMNPHLHYQSRRSAADVNTTDTTATAAAAAADSSAGGAMQIGSSAGPSSALGSRRSSDNGREGTKL